MAKNKKLELDGYDFDGELDLPDFDFGNGPKVPDTRSPTTKLVFAGARGYADNHFSPDNVRNFVKKSLPRGYGEILDTADNTASTVKGLYHKTAQELKPAIGEIKKSSQRLIPLADKVLPKKMAESFKNWTKSAASGDSGSMSAEQMKEAGIQAELGQIFQVQAEEDHKYRTETTARERLRDGVSFNRHKDVLQNLAPMRQSLQALSEYQRKIGYNYQRKSLELQLRSYYVMSESLEETKRQNAETTTTLQGILKNTGLPEFVKLKNSERLKEIIRNRFINGIGDSLTDKRRNFVKNMVERLGKTAQEKVKNTVDGVRSGLGAYESLAELREMQAQFGPQQSGSEQLAELGGGMLSQYHTNKIAKWVHGKTSKNEKIAKGGNRLLYLMNQGPQMALDWAKGSKGIGKRDIGANSNWLWSLKDTIRSVLSPESTNVDVDKLEDTRNVDVFNRRTNRSITDIIPGYLARIYREIKILRTGDENQQLVEFDYTSNKFEESSTIKKNILGKLIGKGDKDWLKRELDEMVEELDKEKKLSPELRRALGRLMMNNNLAGGEGDSKLYSNARSGVYNSVNSTDAEKMAEVVAKYFEDDKTELKRQTFGRQFSNLGTRITDKRATLQDFVNLNQRQHLEELGLLEVGGDRLDMERLRDYLLEDDAAPGGSPTPGGRRVSRQRNGGPAPRGGGRVSPQRVLPALTNIQQPGAQQGEQGAPPPARPSEPMPSEAVSDIVRAIEAANPTSTINDSNRLLATIVEMLQQGIPTGGNGGNGGPRGGRWWNQSVGGLAGRAWDGAGKAAQWLRGQAGNSGRRAKSLFTGGWDMAKKAGDWSKKKFQEFNDVYIEGEVKPRLLAWKLKGGEYFDQASGQVIKSYKDIRGAVVDANGNIVLTVEDARKAFEKSRIGKKLISGLGFMKRQVKNGWDLTQRLVPGIYGKGMELAGDAITKIGELLDQPQDVYIAGKADPVLLAVTMRAGGYASRITSREIRRPSQIDGPVVDERGDVVLTAEQLASGLLNKHGQPLKTGYRGLFQRGKNLIKGAGALFMKSFTKTKDWIADKARGFAGGFDMQFGLSVGRQARNQSVLLLQIRDMLNDRLAGPKTTFSETVEIGAVGGGNAKKLVAGVKDRFGKLKEKLSGNWKDALKEKTERLQEKLREKKNKGKDKMSMLFEKYFGKKKVDGDADGDGDRDGSYRDLLQRQKDKIKGLKEKAAEKAARYTGGKGLIGMGKDKIKGLLDFFKKKKGDDDDGIDIDIDADNDGGRRRRRGRTRPGRGVWGKTKALAGRAGGGLMRGGSMLGRGALAAGGLVGSGLGGSIGGLLGLGGSLVSGAASAAVGAGGMLLSGVGAIGGGLLSVLASPVVLTGLAAAAIGAAGYYGYKYLTRTKLDPWSTLRYAQYGFAATDEKHLQAVFEVEDQLKSAVVFDNGKANLDEKKIDIKKLLGVFGIDTQNKQQLQNFIEWFDARFKPVFLNNMAAMRAADPSKTLAQVNDLTSAQKRQYLNIAKFPEGPYHVTASPFADQSELTIGKREVAAAAEMAEAALQKDEKSSPAGAKAKTAAGAAAAMASVSANAKSTAGLPGVTLPERSDVGQVGKINQLAQQAQATTAVSAGAGMITMSGSDAMANIINTGRLDALTALRYRTYGLTDLVADRVRALNLLEAETQKGLTISKGVATWSGSAETMIKAMGSAFGVQGVANDDAYSWISWFNTRFLPTYLAYVTAMATATKKNDLAQAKVSLGVLQAVDVATMVYTAKGSFNGDAVSVWQISTTPWPGVALNMDVKTTEGNFQSLKDQAKRAVILEDSVNVKQGVTGSSTGTEVKEEAKGGFFSRLLAERKDSAGKPSGNIFSRIYNNAKDMITGSSEGREVAHPGKGTGGDVNAIPMPTGNGSYAALKSTIDAAAKMVGVDPQLAATFAGIESGFNYKVKAGTSSATGLYQFTSGTWSDMMKKFAGKYGIDPSTPPTEPRANALLGMEFLKQNATALSGLGRKLTDTDLYLAHFLGAGGAKKFLSAGQGDIAANILPDAARANPTIFYGANRQPLTIGEVYGKLNGLVRNKAKQFGLDDGSEKMLASAPAAPKTAAVASTAAVVAPQAKAVAIPVSDQAPSSAKAATSGASKVATGATVVAATQTAPDSPVDNVNLDGYVSPRTRNLAAQQQFQRDAAAEALTTTNQILTNSLDVQKKLLENSNSMLDEFKKFAGRGPAQPAVLDQPVQPVKPVRPAARPMTAAPVSMAVNG
jgi:hypothetical protein